MKVEIKSLTFICSEYFGWGGFYGGFGALTKTLAENLVKKGIKVHVLTPKRPSRKMDNYGEINGVKIHSFNSKIKLRLGLKMRELPDIPDTQIFHSQAANRWHNFFIKEKPNAIHLVTEQDPRPLMELKESYFPVYPKMKTLTWRLKFEAGQVLRKKLCQNADRVYVQAKYIAEKVKRMACLDYLPSFLPNPVSIAKTRILKNEKPTVLFLGRWDPIKRPDIMLRIAEKLPAVHFICCGVANPEFKHYSEPLIKKAGELENVNYMGYVSGERKSEVLNKSWLLLNTSSRECLPVTFLEAAAHKMSIVSPNNPDSFASHFGYKIQERENIKEYVDAINTLILDDNWRLKGNLARKYVQENHELKHVIEEHVKIYNSWIEEKET